MQGRRVGLGVRERRRRLRPQSGWQAGKQAGQPPRHRGAPRRWGRSLRALRLTARWAGSLESRWRIRPGLACKNASLLDPRTSARMECKGASPSLEFPLISNYRCAAWGSPSLRRDYSTGCSEQIRTACLFYFYFLFLLAWPALLGQISILLLQAHFPLLFLLLRNNYSLVGSLSLLAIE